MKLFVVSAVAVLGLVANADVKPINTVLGNPCGDAQLVKEKLSLCLAHPRGPAKDHLYLVWQNLKTKVLANVPLHPVKDEDLVLPGMQKAYEGTAAFPITGSRNYAIHHDFEVTVDGGNPEKLRIYITTNNGEEEWKSGWINLELRPETE